MKTAKLPTKTLINIRCDTDEFVSVWLNFVTANHFEIKISKKDGESLEECMQWFFSVILPALIRLDVAMKVNDESPKVSTKDLKILKSLARRGIFFSYEGKVISFLRKLKFSDISPPF